MRTKTLAAALGTALSLAAAPAQAAIYTSNIPLRTAILQQTALLEDTYVSMRGVEHVNIPRLPAAMGTLRSLTIALDVSRLVTITIKPLNIPLDPTVFRIIINSDIPKTGDYNFTNYTTTLNPYTSSQVSVFPASSELSSTITDVSSLEDLFTRGIDIALQTNVYRVDRQKLNPQDTISIKSRGTALLSLSYNYKLPRPFDQPLSSPVASPAFAAAEASSGAAVAAVPEPSTWMMLIAGIAFVGGALRTRRRVASWPAATIPG